MLEVGMLNFLESKDLIKKNFFFKAKPLDLWELN